MVHIHKFQPRGRASRVAALIPLALALSACASLNKKGQGAVVGAGAGAGAGAVIGHQTGSTARGAIIGAVVGGLAGTIIGNQMDQQAKGIKQTVAGATVERVGEGINVTFASGLLFNLNEDQILSTAAGNLRNLAVSLNQYPNTNVLIVGHTDASGTAAYNQALSERRAQSAAAYLETQGVSASRVHTTGRGEMEPVGSNDTAAGSALNRRVEVAIYANAAAIAAAGGKR
jgi:outer membrane protein OmpA-like peptidoglycan-associated protein